jgi:large subunit ribosomal protein L10
MVNVLNKKICEELTALYSEAADCVFVDFQGLTVEEVNTLRSSLTQNNIQMQVVRSALSSIVLKELNREGFEEMLDGPTAVVWGGTGIVQVSKSVADFAKKSKKKLKIKGGSLSEKPIDKTEVDKLTTVPDMPVLLGSIVGAFMDPLQGMANGLNQVLASIANLVDALAEKQEKEAQA